MTKEKKKKETTGDMIQGDVINYNNSLTSKDTEHVTQQIYSLSSSSDEPHRVASPGSMHDTGCLGLVHWDDPEGWYGERGGRGFRMGTHVYLCQIHFDIWQN